MEYIKNAVTGCKPALAFCISCVMYIMFPEQSYLVAFFAVLGAMILDLVTKYYSIAAKNGGLIVSIKTKHINSNAMWVGTSRKVFAYLIVFILAGLSYRVAPVAGASAFLANIVYSILFLRESQSILENLLDSGADLGWLLVFVKKKQNQILEKDESEDDEI